MVTVVWGFGLGVREGRIDPIASTAQRSALGLGGCQRRVAIDIDLPEVFAGLL